jgi:HAD superfamily hydrolase (TIGR01490 family)
MDSGKKVVAAFDFDGTLTKKDTLFDFIIFAKGLLDFFVGIIIISPVLVLFKLGFIKNDKAKQILFSYFFKGESIDRFNKTCDDYKRQIDKICHIERLEKVNWHKKQGHEVVIISASIENWIMPWATSKGISTVIGTQIEVKDGKITGKFSSCNCYGEEKVNRLKCYLPDRDCYILYAYGDSSGDKHLLEYSDYPTLYR